MNNSWKNFINQYKGKNLPRDNFEEFCKDLLNKSFPGKSIVHTNDIKNYKSNKIPVVFLNKFFFDNLNDSRKGQIRNSFKNFINNRGTKKIYAWIVCIPYILDEAEMKWWLSWKEKNYLKHSIKIEIYDSNYCISLSKKLNLYEKWFSGSSDVESIQSQISEDKTTKISNVDSFFTAEKKILENKTHTTTDHKPSISGKNTNFTSSDKTIFAKKTKPFPSSYSKYKSTFTRLKAVITEFDDDQEKEFNTLTSNPNWKNCFNTPEFIITDTKSCLSAFYKAKSNKAHQNYLLGFYYYEIITQSNFYEQTLKHKLEEIHKSLIFCEQKTRTFLYELEGDIHKVRKSFSNAVISYEKGYLQCPEDTNIARKYFETLADSQLDKDLSQEAYDNYKKACDLSPDDESLKSKLKNAKYLVRGDKFSVKNLSFFTAPLAYKKAFSISQTTETKQKLKQSVKKLYYFLAIFLSLLIIFIFALLPQPDKSFTKATKEKPAVAIKKTIFLENFRTLPEQAIFNGQKILNNISYSKIHLIDTAIASFEQALRYTKLLSSTIFDEQTLEKINSTAQAKLNEAREYKMNYINTVQTNIINDSASYFISMRRSSEGLKLFKYIFNPTTSSAGKYGYVDTTMRVVIPPVYDFNYKKMYDGTEFFKDGKAVVCLITPDTTYFYINRQNNRVIKNKRIVPKI